MQNNTFSGLFVGQNIVSLLRVDSTNSYLRNELTKSTPLPEGTVILAEEQYAGRGQKNSAWLSQPGKNLTFSILLNPTFLSPEKQFMLNKAVCIAINDVLSTIIGEGLKIKWPNDIYVNNDKLGGILIENNIRGGKINYSIIGIGLNVNQLEFPQSLKNVTSVSKILQQDYDLKTLLNEICRAIEWRYLQLKEGMYELLDYDYLKKLYRLGKSHQFLIDGSERTGVITGVNEQGFLEVEFSKGLQAFRFKEIAFVI